MSAPTLAAERAVGDRTAGAPAAGSPARLRALLQATPSTSVLGTIALLIGLFGPWLQPALSQPMGAFQLPIALLGTSYHPISWGLPLAVACVLALAGLTTWGRHRPAVPELAAVLALLATVGFFVLSVIANDSMQERLRRDETDLAGLQRLVGYSIPRPHLGTLGPVPLPGTRRRCAVGLALGVLRLPRRSDSDDRGRVHGRRRAVSGQRHDPAGRCGCPPWSSSSRSLCRWSAAVTTVEQVRQAESEASVGDDQAALQHYESALDNEDTVQGTGRPARRIWTDPIAPRCGRRPGGPAGILPATAPVGKDLAALQIIAAAADRSPSGAAVHDQFTAQAVNFLRGHSAPRTVRALVTSATKARSCERHWLISNCAADEEPGGHLGRQNRRLPGRGR